MRKKLLLEAGWPLRLTALWPPALGNVRLPGKAEAGGLLGAHLCEVAAR